MERIEIESVDTVIVDLPLRRLQRFSALGAEKQSVVMIFVRSVDGALGIGESVTPSGPWWGGESVESIKVTIDTYLAPVLIGEDAFHLNLVDKKMSKQVFGNPFAKAGVEMALLDLIGKTLDQPVHHLLGGKVRNSLPVAWPLATGNSDAEIAEAEEKLDLKLHNVFKLKMGALEPEADVKRACKIATALSSKATVRVDPNEMWSESTAVWAIERLQDAGVKLIEQPLPRWNYEGMARLRSRFDTEILIDEGVCSMRELQRASQAAVSDVAVANGVSLYMGTFLESSYGTAANMQLCATLDDLPFGGELVGPLLIAENLCERAPEYRDFELHLPNGVGMAAKIDDEKLNAFRRDRDYSVHAATITK